MRMRLMLLVFSLLASAVCFAESNDDSWYSSTAYYPSNSASMDFRGFVRGGSFFASQLSFCELMPLHYASGSYSWPSQGKPVVLSNSVTSAKITFIQLTRQNQQQGGLYFAGVIYHLAADLANAGAAPVTNYCSSTYTSGGVTYFSYFRPISYIAACMAGVDSRRILLDRLSTLDDASRELVYQVTGISTNLSDVAYHLQEIDDSNFMIQSALYPGHTTSHVQAIANSIAPSASNLAERIYQSGITGGATPLWWLRSLGYDNHFTFDGSGWVTSATPMGMNLLQQKYAASASYDADRQQLINSLMGYRVSGDSYTHDGASNFTLDGRTFDMTDLQAATLPELWSYKARVDMAVNTNDVRRLGRSLVDPDSASNVRKRALDQQATQDAISGALNGRVVPVSVQNWPADGLKVKFDDPTIELTSSQFGAVESIDANLQQLRAAFKDWSGVDDGGRWLPVQDAVLTNIYAIAESLLSLTNRNNDVSNILYSVATSNQLNDIQAEADAFLSQAENDYHELSGLFDAERYIEFRHTNLNFLASSQFAPLRQLADNGTQLPEYVNIQAGSFGSFQFPTVTVPVGHIAPLCNAARWFFRCVWLVLASLFYWFLGLYAVRFYKWVTGKFTGMGYYMS